LERKRESRKVRVFAVASFLELLRPGNIYWKGQNPSVDDLQSVSRIVGVLGRASEKAKLQSIRAFFEGKVNLEEVRKILIGKSLSHKKEALLLVKANHKLKPKEFYARLRGPLKDLGIELSSNPNSYPKQIERLKKQAQAYLATLSPNARP
jgi:exoribonuclease R